MSKLILIPKGATLFEDSGRKSKAKRYKPEGKMYILAIEVPRIKKICLNCKMTWGKHNGNNCPEHYRVEL